jgi:hypothetical protein
MLLLLSHGELDGEITKDSDYVGICINWVDREGKWHLKA